VNTDGIGSVIFCSLLRTALDNEDPRIKCKIIGGGTVRSRLNSLSVVLFLVTSEVKERFES